jgi:hypothetical protein
VTPKQRAERLVWLARENPGSALADLAFACERSERWTAKILRDAGLLPPTPPRVTKPRAKHANLCTPCARPGCNHAKNDHCWTRGKRKNGTGQFSHHFSLQDQTPSGWYLCITNHCLLSNYVEGKFTPCACHDFLDPFAKPVTKSPKKRATSPTMKRLIALAEAAEPGAQSH